MEMGFYKTTALAYCTQRGATFSWTQVSATSPYKILPKFLQSTNSVCVPLGPAEIHNNWLNNKEVIKLCTTIIHENA